jgi:plastocyanin
MRPFLIALAVALVATAASGCGGGDTSTAATGHPQSSSPSRPPHARQLVVGADPGGQLKFTKRQLTTTAGAVTLVMHNQSPLGHNIAIKGGGLDVRGKVVDHGGTSTVHANLKPGTYTFYCSVPGHATAGMTGTLRVR